MLCNKFVFSFMYEAFLFGKRIENFYYAHTTRMHGWYVGGTGGLLHVHCMLPEDYFCLVDIYVWFYPPVVHISQLVSSGGNIKFLPHRIPAPVTSYAVPVIILTFWTVSLLYDAVLLGFCGLLQTIILLKRYRIWCVSYSGIWHCATQYLVPGVLRQHSDLIFGGQKFQGDEPLCCLGTRETKFSVTHFISQKNLRLFCTAAERYTLT
jgi:hypothetical protein